MIKYKDIRDKIQTGDIVFVEGHSLFSRLIKLVTHGKVTHVGILIKLAKRLFVVESIDFKGCRMMLASNYFKQTNVVDVRRSVGATVSKIKILKDVGVLKYDMLGAILSPLIDTKSQQMYCSEFVANKLNLKVATNRGRGIYPQDLLEITRGI